MDSKKASQAEKIGGDPRMMAQAIHSGNIGSQTDSPLDRPQHPEGINGDLREVVQTLAVTVNMIRKAKHISGGWGYDEIDPGYINNTVHLSAAISHLSNVARSEISELLDILRG